MPRALIDLTGQRFGRLTVVERAPDRVRPNGNHITMWNCLCDCGARTTVQAANLRRGHTTSCECLHRERLDAASRTHGLWRSSDHTVWSSLKQRCTNPRNPRFARYGARGVSVCDRWLGPSGFINFLSDMGPRPADTTLDRINNDGNYEPSNCRWATRSDQQRNTSRTRFIEHRGERMPLVQWAERHGLAPKILAGRLKSGWPMDRALSTPVATATRAAGAAA